MIAGRPKTGFIFDNKTKDKLNYKFAIKQNKRSAENKVSDKLQEALLYKNSTSFWKTWKSKISNKKSNKICIKGNPSDKDAVELFATFFQETTSPNSTDFDQIKQDELKKLLQNYTGNELMFDKFKFTSELVALSLAKMNKGKAGGEDSLTVEHLLNCHPIHFSLCARLFNNMLRCSYVPTAFGRGITIPIPKNDNCRGGHEIDSFRGITLSCVISKLFEHCLLILFSQYFKTSDNQFGFKPNVGCQHAVYTVRKVVDHYVTNNSTVNMCFLDLQKGFDKVNNAVLMLKLMKRGIPVAFVKMFLFWNSISYNQVRWQDILSQPYKLLAGVRQGGVLSPVLFSVYVDDILQMFKKYGCIYKGLSVSAIMYADDILLLAPSVQELQRMINICTGELEKLDLKVNPMKTIAMRIGCRFNSTCSNLTVVNKPIQWNTEAKYLGIYIQSGYNFKCNFSTTKSKFYRSANAILSQLGKNNNSAVSVQLAGAIALPILTYCIEALALNKSELALLNHPWIRIFQKCFGTFDTKVVEQCQWYTGYLPINHYHAIRSVNFISKLENSKNILLHAIYCGSGKEDIRTFSRLYGCKDKTLIKNSFQIVSHYFRNSIVF